jgi:PAS domain S-box-containing protein
MKLFEDAITPIIATNENGQVLAWNDTAEMFFGWSEKEMLGKDISEYIVPEKYREKHKQGMRYYVQYGRSTRVGDPHGLEVEALKRDGTTVPVRIYLSKIETKEGFINFGSFITDLTEQKAHENASHNRLKLHEIGEKVGGFGTWCYNVLSGVVECTKGFYFLFGVHNELPNDKEFFMDKVYYEDKDIVNDAIVRAIETGEGYTIKYRVVRPNLSLFLVECIAIVETDLAGKTVELKGTIRFLNEVVA